jgi:Tol biopolymer transport system component
MRSFLLAVLASLSVALGACSEEDAPKAPATADPVLAFGDGCEVWLVGDDWRARHFKQPGWGPDWSPDGSRLAFMTTRGLIVHDVTTGQEREILKSPLPEPGNCSQKAGWAPRGDRLALVLSKSDCVSTLATISLGKRRLVKIAENVVCEDIPFAWSPSGSEVVYAMCDIVGPGGHGERDCTLFRAGADGRSKRRLLRNLSSAGLAWSPDGGAIALHTGLRSGREEGDAIAGSEGLYVLELRSGKMKLVVRDRTGFGGPGDVNGFAWSPDSAWLAYTRWMEPWKANAISLVSRNGNEHRTLIKPGRVEYGELAWSRDRKLIAAEASPDTDVPEELHIIDARNGVIVHRVRGATYWSSLSWRRR